MMRLLRDWQTAALSLAAGLVAVAVTEWRVWETAALALAVGLAAVAVTEWRAWERDRRRPASRPPDPAPAGLPRPRVSVLVAAWNEQGNIGRLVQSFTALAWPDKEMVLCAGGRDRTYTEAFAASRPGVLLLEQQPGEGKWRALARCLEQATGDIIFLTDADCVLNDAAFEATLGPLLRGEADVATGRSHPLPDDERASWFVAAQGDEERYLTEHSVEESLGLHGRNCAVRRTALEHVDGFSGDVPTGTDYALALRLWAAGYRIRGVGASVVYSSYHRDPRAYIRQRSRWTRNLIIHGAAGGDWGRVRSAFIAGAVGVTLLVGPLAGLLLGPVATAVWLTLFAKAVTGRVRRSLAVRRWYTGERPAVRHVWLAPWCTMLDAAAWSMALVDLALPSRRGRW